MTIDDALRVLSSTTPVRKPSKVSSSRTRGRVQDDDAAAAGIAVDDDDDDNDNRRSNNNNEDDNDDEDDDDDEDEINDQVIMEPLFHYLNDPTIIELKPLKSFVSGGRMITVHGTNLDSIQSPEMIVYADQPSDMIINRTVS